MKSFVAGAAAIGENVDPCEAARYDALAATWWDRTGPFWPLHRLNELRTGFLHTRLASCFERDPRSDRPLRGLEVLDVGCGGGILSEPMARLGARVHGIDVVERNLAVARAHAAGAGLDIRYEAVTAAELLSRGAGYDVVLNMEVVEHVPQVGAFLSNCARLVRPGGAMAVATINRTFRSWLFAIVGAEYALGWLPRGTHRWGRFVRPAEVESALARDGLQVEARTGVRVNPFNRRFSLCAAMPVNYMLVARRRAAAARTAGSP